MGALLWRGGLEWLLLRSVAELKGEQELAPEHLALGYNKCSLDVRLLLPR